MTSMRLWVAASAGLVLAMASAAFAWRDCLLLATSMVLAHRLFLLHLHRGAPWRALAATVNALTAGVVAGATGAALIAGIGAARLGWWQPEADHPAALLLMLCAGAAWCCLAGRSREQAMSELRLWLSLLGGVLLAGEAQRGGLSIAPCLLVLVVGMALLWAGWRLATDTASAMLRSASEAR